MKQKNLFVAALLLSCTTSFAQQALWVGSQIVSPEVNSDKTVTFRLDAPNAKEVKVTCDFLPTQKIKTPFGEFGGPGEAELKKGDNGVWEYTTTALSPELYSYSFLVDGLKINDPSNVYQIRDVQSVTNVFLIDADRASLYKVNQQGRLFANLRRHGCKAEDAVQQEACPLLDSYWRQGFPLSSQHGLSQDA